MNNKKIMEELKINEKELEAIKQAFKNLNIEIEDEEIIKHYKDNIVTINKGRDNNYYVWITWNEDKETCVNVDTLEEIDKAKIEELFC